MISYQSLLLSTIVLNDIIIFIPGLEICFLISTATPVSEDCTTVSCSISGSISGSTSL